MTAMKKRHFYILFPAVLFLLGMLFLGWIWNTECENTAYGTLSAFCRELSGQQTTEGQILVALKKFQNRDMGEGKEEFLERYGYRREDFAGFDAQLIIMDVVPWMLPYYEASGIQFEIEDNRDYMDYTFTPEQFLAGMDTQDDRYRYNYFKRRFAYETEEITPFHREEIREFMEREWCGEKTCEECHCGCLLRVIDNLVPVFDKIRINGILVRVEGKMAGLCIVSCRNGLGVYQYKNAVNRIKGINEYLLRESFERYLQSADTINYTEDMGVENLRYYKEHMAPAHTLLSKLTLTERG